MSRDCEYIYDKFELGLYEGTEIIMYRINYGNGQVSGTYTSLTASITELDRVRLHDEYGGFAFLEFYEDGGWFKHSPVR